MSGAKQMNMILVSTKAFNLDVITFADFKAKPRLPHLPKEHGGLIPNTKW